MYNVKRFYPFPQCVSLSLVIVCVLACTNIYLFPVQEVAELQQQVQSNEREKQRLRKQLTTKTRLLVHTIIHECMHTYMLSPFPTSHFPVCLSVHMCVCNCVYVSIYVGI